MFKRLPRFTPLIGWPVIAALVLSACGGGAATTAAPQPTAAPTEAPQGPIKIAIMGPFTGPAASIGVEQLNFARLAVADFNKAMGTNIELLEEDTQLDPAIATTVAQKLVADQALYAVIGPSGSQEVEASATLFEEAKLAHVSPSATRPSLTQSGYKTFFRVVPNDSVQGPTDAHFIADTLKAKSVFIIDDQSSYSASLAEGVAQELSGMDVTTARESVTQEDTDFSALVTKIKAANAEVVFFPGQIASQGAQLWKQMREQGVTATLMGGDGFNSPDLIADGANEGSFVSNFAPDINGVPEAADVIKAYQEQYGDFGSFGPPTYVAAQVVLEAVSNAMKAGALTREALMGGGRPLVNRPLIRAHFIASFVWLGVLLLAGLFFSLQLLRIFPFAGIELLSPGRLRMVHTNLAAYGFIFNAFAAALLWAIPRLTGERVLSDRLGWIVFVAWQAVIAAKGEWVKYSSPFKGGAEYIAVCLPAFSPSTVNRDD